MKKDQRFLSSYEESLVKLVHLLAFGTETEYGFTYHEIRNFLVQPIRKKGGLNALQCLEAEGVAFIAELEEEFSKE